MTRKKKWQALIEEMNFPSLPFPFMRSVIVATQHKEFKGYSQDEFQEIITEIKQKNPDEQIIKINFEPNSLLIKQEIKGYVDPLFQKHFLTKSID